MPDKVAKSSLASLSIDSIASIDSIDSTTGSYPQRNGVILVTQDLFKGIVPLGHAAIICDPGVVVEALSDGVVKGKNNWNVTRDTCWGVTVIETTASQDNVASNYCKSQVGKPYNYFYNLPSRRDAFYCSQLVYASFLDNFGIDLDTSLFAQCVYPMELVWTPKTRVLYKQNV